MVLSMDEARHFQIERSDTLLRALEVISAQKLCILHRINIIKRLLPTCCGDKPLSNSDKLLSNWSMSLCSALSIHLAA